MIYCNKEKYYKLLINDKDIRKIEKSLEIKILFGGAFSSKVYGIDNQFSDFDFYLIYEGDFDNRRIFDKDTFNDYILLDYAKISKSLVYDLEHYPSILFRNDLEVKKTNYHLEDFQTTQKLFEILYSDYIWDSGFLKENIDTIIKSISLMDVIDYYFSRAYGTYVNYIRNKETNAARILRCFLNICCLKWVLEENTIPDMSIETLIDLYAPNDINIYLKYILRKVKSIDGIISAGMHTFDVGTDNLFAVNIEKLASSNTMIEKGKVIVVVDTNFRKYVKNQIDSIVEYIENNKYLLKEKKLDKGHSAFAIRNEWF